jgi:uncharacterized protein YhaN
MSTNIRNRFSMSEVTSIVNRELAKSRSADLGEASDALETNREKSTELRAEVRQLKDEAEGFAKEARDVKQPHTFFGKLFNGRSKAREAQEKAHQADLKRLEAEEARVELSKGERAQKEALEKMQTAIDQHSAALGDLTHAIRTHTEGALS